MLPWKKAKVSSVPRVVAQTSLPTGRVAFSSAPHLPTTMKTIRKIHFYLGVLFAPSIVFFALTGAFQTFSLHESGAAGALTPVLSQMAAIHKNAALENSERRKPPKSPVAATRDAKDTPHGDEDAPQSDEEGAASHRPSPLPLKIYVFAMSLGLIASTATGVWMAFQYKHDRRILWGLLAAGTLLPLLLLFV